LLIAPKGGQTTQRSGLSGVREKQSPARVKSLVVEPTREDAEKKKVGSGEASLKAFKGKKLFSKGKGSEPGPLRRGGTGRAVVSGGANPSYVVEYIGGQ